MSIMLFKKLRFHLAVIWLIIVCPPTLDHLVSADIDKPDPSNYDFGTVCCGELTYAFARQEEVYFWYASGRSDEILPAPGSICISLRSQQDIYKYVQASLDIDVDGTKLHVGADNMWLSVPNVHQIGNAKSVKLILHTQRLNEGKGYVKFDQEVELTSQTKKSLLRLVNLGSQTKRPPHVLDQSGVTAILLDSSKPMETFKPALRRDLRRRTVVTDPAVDGTVFIYGSKDGGVRRMPDVAHGIGIAYPSTSAKEIDEFINAYSPEDAVQTPMSKMINIAMGQQATSAIYLTTAHEGNDHIEDPDAIIGRLHSASGRFFCLWYGANGLDSPRFLTLKRIAEQTGGGILVQKE